MLRLSLVCYLISVPPSCTRNVPNTAPTIKANRELIFGPSCLEPRAPPLPASGSKRSREGADSVPEVANCTTAFLRFALVLSAGKDEVKLLEKNLYLEVRGQNMFS